MKKEINGNKLSRQKLKKLNISRSIYLISYTPENGEIKLKRGLFKGLAQLSAH